MPGPRFAHLTGRAMWGRCDHDGTRIDGAPAAVGLAPADPAEAGTGSDGAVDPGPWQSALGSAVVLPCPPDRCQDATVLLADPREGLFVLTAAGWRPLPRPWPPAAPAHPVPGGPAFSPLAPPPMPDQPAAIVRDPWDRLWLLDRARGRVQLLGADLRVSATLDLPPGFDAIALVCAAFGLIVADAAAPRLLIQPWGGEWRGWQIPDPGPDARMLSAAADPALPRAAALLRDGADHRLIVLESDDVRVWPLPMVGTPLQLVMTGSDTLLVGEVSSLPGDSRPYFFRTFRLTAEGPEAEEAWAVRGFDGRAVWLDSGADGDRVMASTAGGARPLFARETDLRGSGRVETWALDSGIFACVWHRLFVDLCLPPDCSVTIEAKTADDLPPLGVRRAARRPADLAGEALPPAADDPWPPLGSLSVDESDGWVRLGTADPRAGHADLPLPPHGVERPSEEPLAAWRSELPAPPDAMQTLEHLITAPPGRYLWLRIRMDGTRRRGPRLFALRASFPRPSLLDFLPAYWRADPEGGDATERALALFEALTTELDRRTDALVHLLDPALTPAEALPWLAGFVALAFDDRVGEAVRRQLLAETTMLYRQRGTVPGLARLLSILARAPVQIVEGFRLRRPTAAFVGTSMVGPGLELGGTESAFDLTGAEDWEIALLGAHAALQVRRAAEEEPCPPGPLPNPLDEPPDASGPANDLEPDPLLAFYRRHAHRFTVIVPLPCDAELRAVLELAIEANKPAHTIHRLCCVDAGWRIGRASLVGISLLGPTEGPAPAVVGDATLSTFTSLHQTDHDPGPRLFTPTGYGGRLR